MSKPTGKLLVGDAGQRQMDELVAAGIRVDQQEIKRLREALAEIAELRDQLPSQGGEAVEVVAYIDDGGALYTSKLLEIMSVESDGCEPLMTVAQHNRIMADVRANRDAVLKVMQARKLLPKCAPAPDAELVELLQDASQWFADRDSDINLARDIDAKLASLKGVEA